jgi:DNA-binding YbaB/EbfC family protein
VTSKVAGGDMKNFSGIMKQAQKMQEKIAQLQEELAEKTVEASSGGGMVTVVANGKQEIVSVKIDPEVVNKDDVEMLEDLILAAVNEAKKRAEELAKEELSKITGGLVPPGLF